MKKTAARTREALLEAISEALSAAVPEDVEGWWFAHCHYTVTTEPKLKDHEHRCEDGTLVCLFRRAGLNRLVARLHQDLVDSDVFGLPERMNNQLSNVLRGQDPRPTGLAVAVQRLCVMA